MDEVIGTAILVKGESTQSELLYVLCKAEGREPRIVVINAHQEGRQKLAETSWCYRVDGDTLHITPSLHVRYQWPEDPPGTWRTEFHNGYNWSVKFKLAGPGSGYRQLREANGMPIPAYDED
jgi:hypothetical protein